MNFLEGNSYLFFLLDWFERLNKTRGEVVHDLLGLYCVGRGRVAVGALPPAPDDRAVKLNIALAALDAISWQSALGTGDVGVHVDNIATSRKLVNEGAG